MRRLPILLFLGGGLMPISLMAQDPPVAAHPGELQYPEGQITLPSVEGRRVQLPQGPILYLARDPSLPLVEISLAMRVGSFLEPHQKTGLALLTTTQIRRGGTVELEADRFDSEADLLGAQLETMPGTTRTGASLSAPSWVLDEGLDLFFAMISQPGFQEDRLVVTRTNLLESLSRRNEDALEVLQREWEWLMYGENHFSTRPITPDSLAAIEPDDLPRFHREQWQPDRMILAVSGDFDPQDLLSKLRHRFEDWTPSETSSTPPAWPPTPPPTGAPPGLYHYEMDIPQTKVLLGHRLPDLLGWSDPDRFALAVVAETLGGQGAIPRIAGRLRTAEGLVYRASVQLHLGDLWPGQLEVFFETRGESVERALRSALEEIERLRAEPVHPVELAVVKQSLLSRLRLRFDTAGYFAEDELLGRPHPYWQDYLSGVSRVSAAEVLAAAKTYLQPESMRVLTVGRWSEIAANTGPGDSGLEVLIGHARTPLPTRDPLTLAVPSGN